MFLKYIKHMPGFVEAEVTSNTIKVNNIRAYLSSQYKEAYEEGDIKRIKWLDSVVAEARIAKDYKQVLRSKGLKCLIQKR